MTEEQLLQQVAQRGWTERLIDEFRKRYDLVIQKNVLYHLRTHFPGQPIQTAEGVRGDLADLYWNTYNDVLWEVFRPEGNLVEKYLAYRERRSARGQPYAPFPEMLKKSVEFCFLHHWSPRLSLKELLDKIVDSKREETRRYFIAETRERYREEVASQLRSRFPTLNPNTAGYCVDYFFEVFLPTEYPRLRDQRNPLPKGTALLSLLIDRFTEEDCRKGSTYKATIPRLPREEISLEVLEDLLEPRDMQHIDRIPVEEELWPLWNKLLLCKQPSPQKIEKELLRQRTDMLILLLWACARVKTNSPRRDTRENLLVFAVYCLSQCLALPRDPNTELLPEGSLVPGTVDIHQILELGELTWAECCRLFGRQIRKDRIEEQLFLEMCRSPYRRILPPAMRKKCEEEG